MAKPSRKAELALWWDEYRTRVISLTVVVLTFVIILAVFYPFSSEIVIGEVRAVSLSETNIERAPRATIYNPNTGEIVLIVPFGVNLTVGDKVEISRGKTMAGIYKYVFVKKASSYNKSLQSDVP
jgi:hypothetical protein